ncbi:unnamed protein product [Rhizoctonia solani]|uniref:Transmembrane protein n=1 Tax=Rhizoctonia solani TaxID=456999 RepID=A0A8H3GJD8_9AGAM|nr:unnamed protein product [Rhizoctonia solani]
MIAFSRLTTFLLFVFSLGLLTCAAPTSAKIQDLSVRGDDVTVVVNALAALKPKMQNHLDACAGITAEADVYARVDLLVADIKACTDIVVKVGANVHADAKIKAEIVAHIAAIVTLCAKILISLSAKLTVSVMVAICAQIDICLKALLVALNVCIEGVVTLSLKGIADHAVIVFLKFKLALCAEILGLLNVSAKVGLVI